MNIELEKRQIIEEINKVKDEWVLKAIKRLLISDNEELISEEHQHILNDRIAEYQSDPSLCLNWEEVKKELFNK